MNKKEESGFKLYAQSRTDNLCLVYSVLNAIQDPENIKKFLLTNSIRDMSKVTAFVESRPKQLPGLPGGVTSNDLRAYLQHLKDNGIVKSYTFMAAREKSIRFFLQKRPKSSGYKFILCGYTVSTQLRDKLKQKFEKKVEKALSEYKTVTQPKPPKKKRANNLVIQPTKTRKKARTYLSHRSYNRVSKEAMSLSTASFNKLYPSKDVNLHASAVVFDKEGTPWLLDPGRLKPRELGHETPAQRDRDYLDFVQSVTLMWKTYIFDIEFM